MSDEKIEVGWVDEINFYLITNRMNVIIFESFHSRACGVASGLSGSSDRQFCDLIRNGILIIEVRREFYRY